MRQAFIDIRTPDIANMRRGLDTISNKKFPTAVRETLNDAAFHMKGRGSRGGSLEKRANQLFEYRRNKTFIRSITGVNRAKGYNVDRMFSESGVFNKSGKSKAGQGLKKQQTASDISHAFSPMKPARSGNNNNKHVTKGRRLRSIGNYVDVSDMSPKERLKEMIIASKDKTPILIRGKKGKSRKKKFIGVPAKRLIRSKKGDRKSSKIVKMRMLYAENQGRTAKLRKKRPFINKAGEDAQKKMVKYFYKHATKMLR